MRIACPSCATTYDVPAAVLGIGSRPVRCARCGHEWMPDLPSRPISGAPTGSPPMSPARSDPPTTPAAPVVRAAFTQAAPRRGRPLLAAAAWVASLALLAGLGAAAWHYRGTVMTAWPPSERVYAALGAKTGAE